MQKTVNARITDWNCKCKICGSQLQRPETLIHIARGFNTDGRTTQTSTGIRAVDVHAGICDACLKKHLRATVKSAIETDESGQGGAQFGILGIIFSVILFLYWLVSDERKIGVLFFVAIVILVGSIILHIKGNKKISNVQNTKDDRLQAELKLSDEKLLKKYNSDGSYLKLAWKYPVQCSTLVTPTDITLGSEVLKLGTVDKIREGCHVSGAVAEQLLAAARYYK